MFGKTVMHFYVECLCRYKNQKRVYYEFTCYMQDYLEDTEGVLKIIAQYKLPACLGLFYKELGRLD